MRKVTVETSVDGGVARMDLAYGLSDGDAWCSVTAIAELADDVASMFVTRQSSEVPCDLRTAVEECVTKAWASIDASGALADDGMRESMDELCDFVRAIASEVHDRNAG